MIRRLLFGIGFASAGTGLLLLLTPVGAPVSVPVLPALGLVALAVLAVGGVVALGRSAEGARTYDLPDPAAGVRAPGDAFDERLATVSVRDATDRAEIRDRLRTVAAAVLVDTTGCDRATARDRLAEGTWTDDPMARAFFTESPPSFRARVRTVLTGEPTFVRRARRVVAVIADGTEGEG
ncbi:DUF7269 family protein [Halorientalis marina]|uniref:DUF7269 family protein n=1 Tax=Halorientalis marina TaxID=2931976 RepID=UPI001FF385AB|nr:hypothetical protein [Halorientalis marina]